MASRWHGGAGVVATFFEDLLGKMLPPAVTQICDSTLVADRRAKFGVDKREWWADNCPCRFLPLFAGFDPAGLTGWLLPGSHDGADLAFATSPPTRNAFTPIRR
jgi:hypothetical protein